MIRNRVRIRYRKDGDLRWLGHQDLVRAWDRLLRRADVQPAMSEGFHKRPRINFPSALAVGIEGLDEVVELELQGASSPAELSAALAAHAPPGLTIVAVEPLAEGARFSQPAAADYEIRLPAERVAAVRESVERLRQATDENERLPATVRGLDVVGDVLRMSLVLGEAKAVRPRELLARLGLGDLEATGAPLVRTRVEVAAGSPSQPDAATLRDAHPAATKEPS
jgi:radical SAM-linked protein